MAKTSSQLTVVHEEFQDKEWREIVDDLMAQAIDLPDSVVLATEYLLAGWPIAKVAKQVAQTPSTVKGWLAKYPLMALIVANGRPLLQKWRMAKIEQQFVMAIDKSEEILNLDLNDKEVNAKLVATVAQQARYNIGLFAGQQMDINVHMPGEDQTLKAKADALDYIAEQLGKQRDTGEVIEANYTVIDERKANQRPLLLPDGSPPFGTLGELTTDSNGVICHVCGAKTKTICEHVRFTHQMKEFDYCMTFMLPPNA